MSAAQLFAMKVRLATAEATRLVLCALLIAPARAAEPVCPPRPLPPLLSMPHWQSNAFYFRVAGTGSYVLQLSTNLQQWTSFTTNDAAETQPIIRIPAIHQYVFVRAALEEPIRPLFNFALRTSLGVVSNTGWFFVDSYDSSDPNYSGPGGWYDPRKAKDGGDVALGFANDGTHSLGNAHIKGRVFTAESSTVTLGPNGSVGSTAWVDGGNTGIEPGWAMNTLRPSFMPPPVAVPFVGGFVPSAGVVGGVTYNYILTNADYELNAISGSQKMLVTGNARLYVKGPISIARGASIIILPNTSLQLFCAGDAALSVDNRGPTTNFQFYGLASNTNLSSSSTLGGVIYAPHAVFTFGSPTDFSDLGGACIVRQFIGLHANIHFDESLKRFCGP